MSIVQFLRDNALDVAMQRRELENLRIIQTLILLRLMEYPPECNDIAFFPVSFPDCAWTRTWNGQIWVRRDNGPDQGWYQLFCWQDSFRLRTDLKIATVIASSELWAFKSDDYVRAEMVDSEELVARDTRVPETSREPYQSGTPWDRAVAKYEASRLMNEVMGLTKPCPKTAPGR